MIDWKKIAEQNGLTPDEFAKEIFTVAACLGTMKLDEQENDGCLRFKCADNYGQIEVYIRRLPDSERT